MERIEDAGIYKLSEELAIIQTLDFFTPIVDDPYIFGQIAAANALSDVYAKGGKPLTAMNIVCFPVKTMDISILNKILAGGLDKLHEANVTLVGGHSVEDAELKYGLSITGIIHPSKVILKSTPRAEDRLILTKPLGTGIISTAIKSNKASEVAIDSIVRTMTTLNRKASELMQEIGVNACTDITGFGFLGHAAEMIEGTEVGMVVDSAKIPYFPEAKYFAEMGVIPGGLHRNRDYRKNMVDIDNSVPKYLQDILFDPQTSGGLLISVPIDKATVLLKKMHEAGIDEAAIVGEVTVEPRGRIIVK
ncbi:MAG: selenide, water dikinase SelD [Chloroflexi bacterium RBG_16_50_9]|nr:MAG: selenide, water dikinase SelD [Chloroflexi bacterium RBG_16_50_9]